MATIKDVAKMANVSVATVSRFINGTATVSPETAEKISEAIEKLNYLPDSLGRSLRRTKSNYILVLMPSIENSFLSRVIRGIQNVGNAEGYSIIIGITQNSVETEMGYLNLVKTRGVDGIISVAPVASAETLTEIYKNYPIIQCSEYCSDQIPHISINNRKAAFDIVDLMARNGLEKIALISASAIRSAREREAGYREALLKHNLKIDPALSVFSPLGFNGGRKAAESLLEYNPDAVFAVADILALGAMRFFMEAGLSVPNDISVAGIDGIPMSRESNPPLTTVIQPAYEMGRAAARMIIDLINGKSVPIETVLPHRIAIRQSIKIN